MPELSFVVNPFPGSSTAESSSPQQVVLATPVPAPPPPVASAASTPAMTKEQRAQMDQVIFKALAEEQQAEPAQQSDEAQSSAVTGEPLATAPPDISDAMLVLCTFALGALIASLVHHAAQGKLSFL